MILPTYCMEKTFAMGTLKPTPRGDPFPHCLVYLWAFPHFLFPRFNSALGLVLFLLCHHGLEWLSRAGLVQSQDPSSSSVSLSRWHGTKHLDYLLLPSQARKQGSWIWSGASQSQTYTHMGSQCRRCLCNLLHQFAPRIHILIHPHWLSSFSCLGLSQQAWVLRPMGAH